LKDPLIEPGWNGVRVIAHLAGGQARFIDEEGKDCTAEFAEVANALVQAALADSLILDGFLTVEPTQPTEGVAVARTEAPSGGQIIGQMLIGSRGSHQPTKRRLDPDQPIALVAVDLLSVDDSNLLDIPLLERKRLLDGALRPGALVRITPFIRPPISTFVTTWRGMGFMDLAYKSANSRYLPGAQNDDWSLAPMPIK